MFRLHKNRQAKSGERIDFKFSNFKAVQVPKGWDKLFVSVISVENGRTIAKSNKALVRNGTCQWTETISESIWISQDDSSKKLEDCFFKLAVAMGSVRSGILGEATLNMTSYMSSSASIPLSLPLKKCNLGTVLHGQELAFTSEINSVMLFDSDLLTPRAKFRFVSSGLQVKVQCLTPRTNSHEESKETTSFVQNQNAIYLDATIKADGSDSALLTSVGSSSSNESNSPLSPGEPNSRGASSAASCSCRSYESVEGSIGRETFSPRINLRDDGQSLTSSQCSISSQKSVSHCNYPGDHSSPSNHSSCNSQITGSESKNDRQESEASSFKPSGSSKNLLEAAEDTNEELRAEAKMWERNARKLMLDLDGLRAEFSYQSKILENLGNELSGAHAERDRLEKEIEELKFLLKDQVVKQTAFEDSTFRDECVPQIEKELRDELKFQKESNANLAVQLKRSQESNIELVSVLQELEDTIEKQKIEIENISALPPKVSDVEKSFQLTVEGNRNLTLQIRQMEESEKILLGKVQHLELALEDKKRENNKALLDTETEYKNKLPANEKEISSLKAKLSESREERQCAEIIFANGGDENLIKEIAVLKEKVEELERDCNELTDENLELLFKLKEANYNTRSRDPSYDSSPSRLSAKIFTSFVSEASTNKSQIVHFEEVLEKKVTGMIENYDDLSIQELESSKMALQVKVTELSKEVTDKTSELETLKSTLLSKEEEIGALMKYQNELEANIFDIQKENGQLEEHMEVILKESDITSKCLNGLRNDLAVLTSNLDSHVSANKILESKSVELESENHELELHILEIKQEKVKLSECMSALEAELRYSKDERESSQLELENFKSQAVCLQEEIAKLKFETDSRKEYLKHKWSEAQQECESLRNENMQLQAAAESLIEECSFLQKSNGELRQMMVEFQERCSLLEVRLSESEQSFTDNSERIELLEERLALMLEDIASKENALASGLDGLLDEDRKHKEKLIEVENLLNQIYIEQTVEVENLQIMVEQLSKKLSETSDEKEKTVSSAADEVSALCAEKAKLESVLQEVQSKVISSENEVNKIRTEYETKLQDLRGEVAASRNSQELLLADHEKLLKLVGNYKSRDAKVKTATTDLELKITVSEYERQQLMEETKNLKVQLQQMGHLQEKIEALKDELSSTKSERERLEASLHVISEECEDLKGEKDSFVEKISTLQKAVSELEDYKRSRASFEERLLQLEEDLLAKDALCAQDAELKNEFSQIKRMNRQYQQTIQLLKKEKDESLTRAQALEEELKLMKEQKQNQMSKTNRKVLPIHEDLKLSKENQMVNTSPHRGNRRRLSLKSDKELVKDQHKIEVDSKCEVLDESVFSIGVDALSKIQLLESELAKAMEANMIYEVQLNRLLSQGQDSSQANAPIKSKAEGEVVARERFERTKSTLEAELRDIRERYFHMSLKYAEVEAQREELVMKLKVAKSEKRWFS